LESHQGHRRTRLLIDCGIGSQRACTQILEEGVGLSKGIDGLLVTHAHSDHVNYSTLRVMDRLGIPVYAHDRTAAEIGQRYLNRFRVPASVDLSGLELRRFGNRPFRIDGFRVTPIAVPHAPHVTTHAFAIRHGDLRLLLASDFHDPESVIPHIYDCDLIYLEANYDPELLRRHFNPASLYHMPNPAAGLLLQHALERSKAPPAVVVLGHLSEERNRPALALETVEQILSEKGLASDMELVAAPRYDPTEPLVLEG
jgi:phosphoribosyl 1,2-cyclic phosphodiesterase